MKFNSYRLVSNTLLALSGCYLATFVLYYLSNYIYMSDVLAYVWIFVQRATYVLMPLISVLVTLIVYAFLGTKKAVICGLSLGLPRAVYLLPYYYLKIIIEGYDSVESLSYGALLTAGELIIGYVLTAIAIFIADLIITKRGKAPLCEKLAVHTVLDFADPVSLTMLIASAAAALYFVVNEIIDTVSFIAEYGTRFSDAEIIYLVISFILDILIPCGYYIVLSAVKNRTVDGRLTLSAKAD